MRKLQSFTVPQPNPVCVKQTLFWKKDKRKRLTNPQFYSQKDSPIPLYKNGDP